MIPRLRLSSWAPYYPFIKWSVMVLCLLWQFIFLLASRQSQIPEFVYVNF